MSSVLQSFFDELRPSLTQLIKEVMVDVLEPRTSHYPERVPVDVASEITGYTKNSLYQMHSKGKVPGAHKVGGKLMFETAALQEWVANGGRAA